MNISIRDHIKNNFKDSDVAELQDSIEQSVDAPDEVVLPGLGVMFEILWKNSQNKEDILSTIHNNIK